MGLKRGASFSLLTPSVCDSNWFRSLSQWRVSEAKMSLHRCTVSPEPPSLVYIYTNKDTKCRFRKRIRLLAPPDCCAPNIFLSWDDENAHNNQYSCRGGATYTSKRKCVHIWTNEYGKIPSTTVLMDS